MTTPFDIRTEQLAGEYARSKLNSENHANRSKHFKPEDKEGYIAGRNSARESLEILAKALIRADELFADDGERFKVLRQAFADVKKRGDWLLEETP